MTDEQQPDAAEAESLDDAAPEQPEEQETVWIGDREFRIQRPQSNGRLYRWSHLENKVVPA